MDEDAQLERDLLLARRLKVAVRLVVYPLLIGALVLALHIRHAQASGDDAPDERPTTTWTGQFGGQPATIGTRDGIAVHFTATLVFACDDATYFTFKADYGEHRLVRTGNVVTYRKRSDHSMTDDGSAVVYDQDLTIEQRGGFVDAYWGMSLVMTRAGTGKVVHCRTAPVHAWFQEVGAAPGTTPKKLSVKKAAAALPRPATRIWRSLGQPQVARTHHGRVVRFDGAIRTRCGDGRTFYVTWHAAPAEIHQRGATATVSQVVVRPRAAAWGGGRFTYRARARVVVGADAVTATTSATVRWRRDGRTTTCRRGPVRQTLDETVS